jgi:multidrug resistance efflux pump
MTTTTTEIPPTAEAPPAPQRLARRRISGRTLILGCVILIVLAAAGTAGYNYWSDSQRYLSTDDALVDSNLVSIASTNSGTLAIWKVRQGQIVKAGQTLGVVRAAPGSTAPSVNITAPIDGTILRVDGKEGQVVGAAQALAYIADLRHLTITAFIDETAIHRVKIGQPVEVTVDASESTLYHGAVSAILPAAASQFALIPSSDRSTGNFTKVTQRVEVHIDLGDTTGLPLYPGENANVRIQAAS